MILTQYLNMSSIYSDPGIYFLVLTRMVENDMQVPVATGVDEFDSVVRGHHIYKMIGEMLQVVQKDTNEYDEYTIAYSHH